MALLETAIAAEKNLEKLATGLAQAGTDDATVKTISQMAEVARKVVSALGKGQEHTADNMPPEGQQPAQPPDAQAAPDQQPQTIGQAADTMPLPGH